MDTVVKAVELVVSYGKKRVLNGADLAVGRGEIVGLVGINGAGKSTLVDVLSGAKNLDTGHVVLAGERFAPESREAAQAAGVGVIEQNFAQDPAVSVAKALFRNTFRAEESHEQLRERAVELLDEAGVELDADGIVADLDRGQQALVEVTRMLAEEAQFVLMDEVAATLADHEIAVLHHVMRRLTAQGRGILYITHRMDELLSIANRVVILKDGRVMQTMAARSTSAADLTARLTASPVEPGVRPDPLRPVPAGVPAIELVGATVRGAFEGLDLAFRRGEIVAIVGAPKSGVREVLQVLGGARKLDGGSMLREGKPVQFAGLAGAEAAGIGYLPDSAPNETASDKVVDAVGAPKDLRGEIRRARRMIGLVQELRIRTTDINADVDTLSGGDQQKTALVSRFEMGHEVLALAHPTRGIDVVSRRAVFKLLRRLADSGVSVVVLTADMSEVMHWADRAVVMRDGKAILNAANQDVDEDSLVADILGHEIYSGTARRAR
ncbi:ATP-binding cassette domain-containing protein [Galactobacter caseinivorans]|uniref:ATP-binding cassette domain-containing protein n=1 Tax=Galactobacter caseinivorans TaxID=2676123 RepID=UPI001314EB1E|nr:ATP-binding cassette domain-containing protein [Galactobacter caseinivorans]